MSQLGAASTPGSGLVPVTPNDVGTALVSARRVWTAALMAGVVAGATAWLGGEAIRGAFQPVVMTAAAGPATTETERLIIVGLMREAAHAFEILGGALGLTLGLAGGWARRCVGRAVVASLIGSASGVAAAAITAAILIPIASAHRERLVEELFYPILILGGIWSAIGLTGGLAFGVGLGGPGRIASAALGGLLGAVLAIMLYVVLGAIALPLSQTGAPIPETSAARLIARLALAILAAAGAATLASPGAAAGNRPKPGTP